MVFFKNVHVIKLSRCVCLFALKLLFIKRNIDAQKIYCRCSWIKKNPIAVATKYRYWGIDCFLPTLGSSSTTLKNMQSSTLFLFLRQIYICKQLKQTNTVLKVTFSFFFKLIQKQQWRYYLYKNTFVHVWWW